MSVLVQIEDPATSQKATVTERGQLVVSNISFSASYIATIDAANTAFNLVLPEEGKKFVVTAIVLTGDKDISAVDDAIVILYEAANATTTTEDNILIEVNIARSATLPLTGLDLITETAAKFINIKSSDINIKATLMGFFVEE